MGNFDSSAYWDARYRDGGTSGAGSRGRLADFKARFINHFIASNAVGSVIELGCGEGAQLELLDVPSYIGVDAATRALEMCRDKFGARPGYSFLHLSQIAEASACDLGLSMDVLYNLVEDDIFEGYLRQLFLLSTAFAVIYSSDGDMPQPAPHVRHRPVSAFIARRFPEWRLAARIPNRYTWDPRQPEQTSFADFLVYVPVASERPVNIRA